MRQSDVLKYLQEANKAVARADIAKALDGSWQDVHKILACLMHNDMVEIQFCYRITRTGKDFLDSQETKEAAPSVLGFRS